MDTAELDRFVDYVEKGARVTGECDGYFVNCQGPLCTDVLGACLIGFIGIDKVSDFSRRIGEGYDMMKIRDEIEDSFNGEIGFINEFFNQRNEVIPNSLIVVKEEDKGMGTPHLSLKDSNRADIETICCTWMELCGDLWDSKLFRNRVQCAQFLIWLYSGVNGQTHMIDR